MQMAYADPPYLGTAVTYYGEQAAIYDTLDGHRLLIERLCDEFRDGWALSLTSGNLRDILPLCPAKARVMAWVKPFASFKPNVNPAYAWEPVIVMGGRKRGRTMETVRDWTAANITLRRGFTGAKPAEFCYWIFDVLNLEPEDDFVDIFPGSGAVTRAWETWRAHRNVRQLELIA